MDFVVDTRIESSCIFLDDWSLSRVFLKNNKHYPWLILVPRQCDVQEIDQLSESARHLLVDEISTLSSIVKTHFKPDKLNVGTLGNIVPQLHVHVIARFTHDALWPQGVWQAQQHDTPYAHDALEQLVGELKISTKK